MRYDRLFTFGCSFTSWHYATWADIMGQEFGDDKYFNLGMCASGNEFAFHRLTEAHARYDITPDDLVIICWTNFAREDRHMNGDWVTAGNIFGQGVYPEEWVKKWFDLKGALIKTSSFIAGATHLLDSIGCDYVFGSAFPMTQIDEYDTVYTDPSYDPIFQVYHRYYQQIQPSLTEYLYGRNVWENPDPVMIKFNHEDPRPWPDSHPNVLQQLKYVQDIIIPNLARGFQLSESTLQWAQDWHDRTRNGEYFLCDEGGQNFPQRWGKYHGHLL